MRSEIPLLWVSWNVSRMGVLHCRSSASCPCADGHDRARGSFNGQELVAIRRATICVARDRNCTTLAFLFSKIHFIEFTWGTFPPLLVVWCGHPQGVVTASGCAPTPRAQHQASGPHVGSPLHRLNSSGSIKTPPPTRHIVPPVSHSLAVRGPLASTVTVHCLRQHDFIPRRARAAQDRAVTPPTHRESLIRYLPCMSEMMPIMYLDFGQVLPHDAPSQPVRRKVGGGGGDPRSR